jgi:hypothetical protein
MSWVDPLMNRIDQFPYLDRGVFPKVGNLIPHVLDVQFRVDLFEQSLIIKVA